VTLVVTADDLGLSKGVTEGILESHRRGVVRSTSLLVTYPSSEAAAAGARDEAGLEIGLHLDLVGGAPASDPARVRSLVDPEGRFVPLRVLVRRLATAQISAREVAAELRAQAARARGWGITPLAWDSHRHVHALPQLARVVGAVAREEGVRWIRRPRPAAPWHGLKAAGLRYATALSEPFYRGIPGNTWYIDLSSWRPVDGAAIAHLATRAGLGEIGAHPGYPDAELRAADSLTDRRPADLALLTDPLLRSALGRDSVVWRVG